MIKIAIDAMGGDNGSSIVVSAVNNFLKDHNDVIFYVVGKKEELTKLDSAVSIIDSREVMGMEDGALEILRRRETSMLKAINLVADKTCDGVVSCGSTGAFLSAATIKFKLIPNVLRAALISPFPTLDGKGVTMLDIGASNENRPEHLVQFAHMGEIYSKCAMGVKDPKVYLLSNGAEEKKGSPVGKEAHHLLKDEKNLNFMGNIEARYVLTGEADVVVCEGYPGNVMLKTIEGTANLFKAKIKDAFKTNLFTKIGYLFAKKGFDKLSTDLDYKKYGGAMLVGINGVAVKGHGNSDEYSFYHAIKVAYNMIKNDMVNKIKEAFEDEQESEGTAQ